MKLRWVKVQAFARNTDIGTIPVVCNNNLCAYCDFRTSLWALNQGCGFVKITARNLKFRSPAIRFFTAHGNELARHKRFRPIALFILDGIFGNLDE